MFTGYDGSYGELDNQGYYVGGDGMEFQYPVSMSISYLIEIFMLLNTSYYKSILWLVFCNRVIVISDTIVFRISL